MVRNSYWVSCLLASVFLVAVLVPGAQAQDAPIQIRLEPTKPVSTAGTYAILNDDSEVIFKKEPSLEGKVFRTAIRTSEDPSQCIGVILEEDHRRIYLDFNRNLDLTDDGGPFPYHAGWYDDESMFTAELNHSEDLSIEYTLAFRHLSREYCQFQVLSGWRGEALLDGRSYRIEFVDNLNGVPDSGDQFSLIQTELPGNTSGRTFWGMPGGIAVAGKYYVAELTFAQDRCVLTLTQGDAPTGTLRFENPTVSQVVLTGSEKMVLAEPVDGLLVLPVGEYTVNHFNVSNGCTASFSGQVEFDTPAIEQVHIEAGATTTTQAGFLAPRVDVTRRGSVLVMSYVLQDSLGRPYNPPPGSLNPTFSITKNGREIKAGQFEYG